MINLLQKYGKNLIDVLFRKHSTISPFKFSSLPAWYRLTWLAGAILLVVLIHITGGAIYFTLISRAPAVGCEAVEKLITEVAFEQWKGGESYIIQNQSQVLKWVTSAQYPCGDTTCDPVFPTQKLKLFYFYTPEQKINANTYRFRHYAEQCPLTKVIGELYPAGFTYSNYVNGFRPDYVVNEDLMIYGLLGGMLK